MNYKLFDVADVIRSKNAGPYEITFDIIIKDEKIYEQIVKAEVFNKSDFAKLYGIRETDIIKIVNFHPANAIKITMVRPLCSGDLGETDVYGAQLHYPLLKFEFEM